MVATKLVFVLLLAVGASQAAHVKVAPTPKDLRVVVEQAIQILKIINENIQAGITQAKPIIQALEGELQEDLREQVRTLLLTLEAALNDITAKLQALDNVLLASIAALNKQGGACVGTTDTELDVVLTKYEKQLSVIIQGVLDENEEEITSLKDQVLTLVNTLNTTLINGVNAGVACVKPGSPDVKACLDTNTVAFNAAIAELLASAVLLLNEALSTVGIVLNGVLPGLQEVVAGVREEGEPIIARFGDCVGKLPAGF